MSIFVTKPRYWPVQLIVEIELRQHLGLMPTKMADSRF
jgi:hypothetical protein